MKRIPFLDLGRLLAPDRAALLEAFASVLDSGRFILGSELERFEAEFARYCGAGAAVCAHVAGTTVAINSGSSTDFHTMQGLL